MHRTNIIIFVRLFWWDYVLFCDGKVMDTDANLTKEELLEKLKSVKKALEIAKSEKNIAELKLSEKNEVISRIENLTKTYNWERDYATNTYTISVAAAKMLRVYPETTVPVEKVWEFIDPSCIPILIDFEQSEKEPNKTYKHHYTINYFGERLYFQSFFNVEFDDEGTPIKEVGLWQDLSEAKIRENSLKEQNDILQNVQDIAKIGYWKSSAKNNKVILSKKLQEILGIENLVDENNAISREFFLRQFRIDPWTQVFGNDKDKNINSISILRNYKTEEPIHLYYKARIYRDENSDTEVISGVAQDITERVTIQNKLHEIEYERAIILDSISSGVLLLDTEKKVLWSNPMISNILNTQEQELIGKDIHEILLGEYSKCQDCILNDMLHGITLTQTIHKATGNKICQIAGNPIYSAQGKVKGLVLTIDDITELMSSKNDLKLLNTKLEQTIENLKFINEASLELLRNPEIKQISDSFLHHLLKQTKSSLVFFIQYDNTHKRAIPIHFESNMTELDSDEMMNSFNEFSRTIYNLHHDTTEIIGIPNVEEYKEFNDIHLTESMMASQVKSLLVAPIIIKENPFGAIGICNFFEVKEWTENDIALAQAAANLVSLAVQRQEFENKIIEAKEKAEESDRLKTAFLASISHEIRTPLNSIVGFTNLIVMETNVTKYKNYYNVIKRNSDLLISLITDILDYSKMEAGVIQIKHEFCNINEICKSAIQYYITETADNVSLRFIEPEQSIVMETDGNRLTQILNNIIGNAVKFTQEGTIDVSYVLTDKDITFFVKDTGIGIPKDKFDVIFERFIKLDRFIQGTGLGLPLVKNIIDKMGGRIWVESTVGKGSVFFFSFPLHQN